MKLKYKIFILCLVSFVISSCSTCNLSHKKDLSPFPPSPEWMKWNKNPIKSDNGDGTVVVDENVVGYAIQAKKWSKRVEDWKYKNQVP